MIEFDVETTGLQWYHHDVFLAQFLDDQGSAVLRHPQDRDEIQRRLLDSDGYQAWNSKFDLHMLRAEGYELPPERQWHDAMVKAHICDERIPNALAMRHDKLFARDARADERELKAWLKGERKRRREVSKDTGEAYVAPNYSDVPMEIMHPYALGDVIQTREVAEVYDRTLATNDELRDLYELERRVMAALFWAEDRGIPIDREGAVRYEHILLNELEQKHDRCVSLSGIPHFNPNSSDQIAEALRRRGADLSFVAKTETGKLSMDAENLGAVNDELAIAVLDFRGTSKLYNTYIKTMLHPFERRGIEFEPLLDGNDRLHPSTNQVGARTGRMSSSDPNYQNWHRDNLALRHLVRAEEGKVLVTVDLNAIEARILAAYAPGGAIKDIILNGADLHSHTESGVGLRAVKRADGSVVSGRDRAKTFFYSIMYGAGVRSLRKQLGVSTTECRQMLNRFHNTYPEIGELQNKIEAALVDNGYVKTAWGRRQRPYGSKSWEIEKEAYMFLNYVLQGTAADLIKDATARSHEAGVPIIGVVHDEIVAEVDETDAEEAGHEIVKAMVDQPRLTKAIPLEAEAKVVKHWSQAKDPGYQPPYAR